MPPSGPTWRPVKREKNLTEIIQGSVEWHQLRLGKVTASRVADIVARTKTGPAALRANYAVAALGTNLGTVVKNGIIYPIISDTY